MTSTRLALPAALAALCAAFPAPAAAQNLVDLSWSPTLQTVQVDDEVHIDLFATSDGTSGQPFSGLDAILDWDPALLELIGFDNSGAGYAWFLSGFLPDPDGINGDLTDGSALFSALAQAGTPAVASAGVGLKVTTMRFKALAPTATGTTLAFTPALGQFGKTRVLDFFQPGLEITGDISSVATVVVTGGPQTYCTAKPSSIPGCIPSIGFSGTPSASAGSGFVISAGPMPGKNNGLFIYTTSGPAVPPIPGPFGFLCVNPGPGLFRIGPQNCGGSTGVCNGNLTFDFNAYAAVQLQDPNLVVGAQVDVQAWYRDPPNVGTANLTNAGVFVLGP